MEVTETIVEQWEYQSDRALVVPHVGGMPSASFPEDFLIRMYFKTKEQGLFRRTFPGHSDFSLEWFISYFYKRSFLVPMVKPGEVAGISWIYEVDGPPACRKASIGFLFFKEHWGETVLQECARLGVSWFFQEAGISILYATIAHWNRLSVRYAKMIGFKMIGTAPKFFVQDGQPVDVDLMYLKREDFTGNTPERFETISAERGV